MNQSELLKEIKISKKQLKTTDSIKESNRLRTHIDDLYEELQSKCKHKNTETKCIDDDWWDRKYIMERICKKCNYSTTYEKGW